MARVSVASRGKSSLTITFFYIKYLRFQPISFNYPNVIRRWQEGSLTYEERMYFELVGRMCEEHANTRGTSYLPPEFQKHPTIDNFIILGFTLLVLNPSQQGQGERI